MSIPAGYTRVEFLESVYKPTGSTSPTDHPYICITTLGNTPFKKGEYKLKMRRYDNGEMRLMGFGNTNITTDHGYSCCNVVGGSANPKNVAFNYGGTWSDILNEKSYVGMDIEVDYKFEEGTQSFSLNGDIYTSTKAFTWAHTCTGFYLFRVNDQMYKSNRMMGSARIYYAQVYNDGVLVADLVPVAKDGIGYMYDSVSNQVFGAVAGSGQFVCGGDFCKFKDPANKNLCRVINGCCQFQENGFESGLSCSIMNGYKDLVI